MSSRKKSTRPPSSDRAPASSRALWTGSVSFGLVQIPVRLLAYEQTRELAFHQLDRRDRSPVGYEHVNKTSGKRVDWKDIVKGYEVSKGEYVIVTDDDFRKADVEGSQTIDIQDFVEAARIPAAFFDRPYYVLADKRGTKAYAVLRDTMARKGLAAVALVVLRTRQHLAALFPQGDLLVLELLRFASGLRPAPEFEAPSSARASRKETMLAEKLIGSMVVDWDPRRYKDTYRDDLLSAIRQKAKTGSFEPRHVPPPAPALPDLTLLLQKSMAAGRKRSTARRKAA
jgi:DNA end-binding protein Ku